MDSVKNVCVPFLFCIGKVERMLLFFFLLFLRNAECRVEL